ALAMVFLILLQQASDLGGLLIVMIGVSGIMLRWVAAPIFVLLILTYFMVTPTGIPGEWYYKLWEIEESTFRPPDVILAMPLLVYVGRHSRIYGLTTQAVAFEGAARRKEEPVTRRPPALITPLELGILLGVSVGLVIAGQVVWWLLNNIEIAAGE